MSSRCQNVVRKFKIEQIMLVETNAENALFGAIEAGGTKFNCALGNANGEIFEKVTFRTTTPNETLAQAKNFFLHNSAVYGGIQALGIAHFGPVDINRASVNYGKILETPKFGWSNTDIVTYFSEALSCPIAFQSDVNAAAIGEHYFGAAVELDDFVYVTVGTGIGGGVFINGKLLNQLRHPELGHMLLAKDNMLDPFTGCCPFHGNCLEGLAAGPAIHKRWGKPAEMLGATHPAWELEAHYLAMLCVNLNYCYAPQKIIFGGGVMQQPQLIGAIRRNFKELLRGYSSIPVTVDEYISLSFLKGESAIKGALVLAQQCHGALNLQ